MCGIRTHVCWHKSTCWSIWWWCTYICAYPQLSHFPRAVLRLSSEAHYAATLTFMQVVKHENFLLFLSVHATLYHVCGVKNRLALLSWLWKSYAEVLIWWNLYVSHLWFGPKYADPPLPRSNIARQDCLVYRSVSSSYYNPMITTQELRLW